MKLALIVVPDDSPPIKLCDADLVRIATRDAAHDRLDEVLDDYGFVDGFSRRIIDVELPELSGR
jgi:hypothetical protein